jgi:FkbM family methyltransferase
MVYAFEPDKTNFSHLQKNTKKLNNVTLFNKAVSDKTGTITLYQSELLNVDHKTYATENYTSKTEIDCVAIDDIIKDKKVDFIKIDIQGYEYFAFQGMIEVFNINKDLKIITEFYPLGLANAKIEPLDFFKLLWQNNFIVYKHENNIKSEFLESDINRYMSLKDEYTFVDLFIEKIK